MNEIIDWFTRKRLLFGAVLFLVPSLPLFLRELHYALNSNFIIWGVVVDYVELFFYFLIPILFFSTIFLFIKSNRTFTAWKKSLLVFLVIYIIILIQVPWYDNDAFLNLINKSNVAKLLALCYSIFSLIFITILALKDSKGKK